MQDTDAARKRNKSAARQKAQELVKSSAVQNSFIRLVQTVISEQDKLNSSSAWGKAAQRGEEGPRFGSPEGGSGDSSEYSADPASGENQAYTRGYDSDRSSNHRQRKRNGRKKGRQDRGQDSSRSVRRDATIDLDRRSRRDAQGRGQDLNRSIQRDDTTDQGSGYESWKDAQALNAGKRTIIEPVINVSGSSESSIKVEKDVKIVKSDKNSTFPQKAPIEQKIVASLGTGNKSLGVVSDKIPKKTIHEPYNLIHSPRMTLKQNTKVGQFRDELNHYRKVYSNGQNTSQSA